MLLEDETRPALGRGVRLNTDAATGEPILLFPEGVVHLSQTAHDILSRCDGRATITDIVSALAEEYDVERSTLSQDVLDCLQDLLQRRLIVCLP